MTTDLELELHDILHATGDLMDVSDGSLAAIESRLTSASSTRQRWPVVVAVAAVAMVLFGAVAVFARRGAQTVATVRPGARVVRPMTTAERAQLPHPADAAYVLEGIDVGPEPAVIFVYHETGQPKDEAKLAGHIGSDPIHPNAFLRPGGSWPFPGPDGWTLVVGSWDEDEITVIGNGKFASTKVIRIEGLPPVFAVALHATKVDDIRAGRIAAPKPDSGHIHSNVRAAQVVGNIVWAISSDANEGGPVYVTRFDATTRERRTSGPIDFPATSFTYVINSDLYVASNQRSAIWVIDGDTFAVRRELKLDEPALAIKSGSGVLVGGAHALTSYEPETWTKLWSVHTSAPVADITAAKNGKGVYDMTIENATVERRDQNTGRLLSSSQLGGPGGGTVSWTNDGIWVSHATGTRGTVDLLDLENLAVKAHVDVPPDQGGSNAITALSNQLKLWIYDPATGSVMCSDQKSGAIRKVAVSARDDHPQAVLAEFATAYLVSSSGVTIIDSEKC